MPDLSQGLPMNRNVIDKGLHINNPNHDVFRLDVLVYYGRVMGVHVIQPLRYVHGYLRLNALT